MGGLLQRSESDGIAVGETPFARFAADPQSRAAWAALLHRAADPNPFFGPDFLIPLVETLAPRADLRIAFARAGGQPDAPLVGLLPLLAPRRGSPGAILGRLAGLPRPIRAFVHPMVVDTTPLLDHEAANEAAHGLLALLAARSPGALLRLPYLRAGTTSAALAGAADRLGLPRAPIARFVRAGLDRDLSPAPSARRARELRRLERRLSGSGEAGSGDAGVREIAFETITHASPERLAEALEAFLALEASGWKGEAGTALACDPARLAFARRALDGGSRAPAIAIDLMRLDGRPIAAAVHLVAGDGERALGGTFKCAFDEDHSSGSPGVQLDAYTARALAEGRLAARYLDSCALPGHPVEALWPERLAFCDEAILLAPGAPATRLDAPLARLSRIEATAAALRRFTKRLLRRKSTPARG